MADESEQQEAVVEEEPKDQPKPVQAGKSSK